MIVQIKSSIKLYILHLSEPDLNDNHLWKKKKKVLSLYEGNGNKLFILLKYHNWKLETRREKQIHARRQIENQLLLHLEI